MDLRLYGRVLWRFRVIVAIGLVLALALTLLSIARVSFKNGRPSLTYRQQETWQSTSRIFITQNGSPLVRSIFTKLIPLGTQSNGAPNLVPVLGDPNRFSSYSELVANLATSDDLRRLMLRDGPVPGGISAAPAVTPGLGTPLPLVDVSGLATTPKGALVTAKRGVRALLDYFRLQQDAQRLKPDERIVLKVLNKPGIAAKIGARSKTRPVVVFLAAAMAVLGLVFVLENLRPRLRPLERDETRPLAETTRRSA